MNALAEAIRPEVEPGPALWQRAAEPGGEDKCEQLGFVADFCEGDDAGRDEEGFHVCVRKSVRAGDEKPMTNARLRPNMAAQ